MNIFNVILLLSMLLNTGFCEVYTSTEQLKDVLEIENDLVGILEKYVAIEKRKIELLEGYIRNQKPKYAEARQNIESYIGNPINSFLLIKRLIVDWKHVEKSIKTNTSKEFFQNISTYKQSSKFPTEEDLSGVATGLIRLQITYEINETSILNGQIGDKKYNLTLSGSDCYEMGKEAYASANYYRAFTWLKQADAILKTKPDIYIDRRDVLERLSVAAYRFGYTELAKNYTKDLLKLSPENERALQNLASYTKELENGVKRPHYQIVVTKEKIQSDQLCRKEVTTPIEITSKLKCQYVNNDNPFLVIGPFKVEELYLNPKIIIFHNIMSDEEIEVIKNLSLSRLHRSKVRDNDSEKISSDKRISKLTWLNDSENVHLSKISQRISDMTGLSMVSAEQLQVVNYGVGGVYQNHFDYCPTDTPANGHRIATVLIYMSDVEQGGATVFPLLNVTIWPKKGTAALWYNLDPYGDFNNNTLHSGCPVLTGSKWAANKWIHQHGQEFRKLCPLHKEKHTK